MSFSKLKENVISQINQERFFLSIRVLYLFFESKRYIFINKVPIAFSMSILCLGYLGFITLWNFDLGYPGDTDLMLSMSFPINILLLYFLYLLLKWRKSVYFQ